MAFPPLVGVPSLSFPFLHRPSTLIRTREAGGRLKGRRGGAGGGVGSGSVREQFHGGEDPFKSHEACGKRVLNFPFFFIYMASKLFSFVTETLFLYIVVSKDYSRCLFFNELMDFVGLWFLYIYEGEKG